MPQLTVSRHLNCHYVLKSEHSIFKGLSIKQCQGWNQSHCHCQSSINFLVKFMTLCHTLTFLVTELRFKSRVSWSYVSTLKKGGSINQTPYGVKRCWPTRKTRLSDLFVWRRWVQQRLSSEPKHHAASYPVWRWRHTHVKAITGKRSQHASTLRSCISK